MSDSPRHEAEEDPEELEAQHFAHVIRTFREYETYHLSANNRRRNDYFRIPLRNQGLLDELDYRKRLDDVDDKIAANGRFLEMIVNHPDIFAMNTIEEERADQAETPHSHLHDHEHSPHGHSHSHKHATGGHQHPKSSGITSSAKRQRKKQKPTDFDMDKLRSTLKQMVRDWSAEGAEERAACYKPMLDALFEHFRDIPIDKRLNIRVLTPGAGLARLAWEVAKAGFSSQGNEFSHFMLLSSFCILNRTEQVGQHTIYPFLHTFSNVRSAATFTTPIRIPDVQPAELPDPSDFSLVAGDFVEIYGVTDEDSSQDPGKTSHESMWDAVLTCFFIDTAKDIVEYLRIIHRILAPGGIWINLGPLLWHFENNTTGDPSIELTLDDVKTIARKIGFDLSNERTIPTTYTGSRDGMLRYEYQAEFWVAVKR